MYIDKDKLLANIKDIKNIANIKMLACTKNLFSKIGIINFNSNISYNNFIYFLFKAIKFT